MFFGGDTRAESHVIHILKDIFELWLRDGEGIAEQQWTTSS
jgi:hypothetical protein